MGDNEMRNILMTGLHMLKNSRCTQATSMITQNFIRSTNDISVVEEGYLACRENGMVESVKMLINDQRNAYGRSVEKSLNVFAENHLGRNAFMIAAFKNQIEVSFYLK